MCRQSRTGVGCCVAILRAGNRDFVHAHRRQRTVITIRSCLPDAVHNRHPLDDTAENRVFGVSRGKPIQKRIVHGIDEKLAGSAIRRACVGHRQCARLVRYFRIRRMFILDRSVRTIARACASTVGIAAVRTAELNHEVVDDAMKVQAIVEAAFRKRDEVLRRDGHLVEIQLDSEVAERCFAKCGRVCHGRAA